MPSANDIANFDYIIVGGGTAGCVVAARLIEALPDVSIALIEAGEDANSNPMVQDPRAAQSLHETDLQWKYTSTPQEQLGGRTLPNWGGKLLSGSSAVNYTAWTRGHAADYDRWAKEVGDDRWSSKALLPGFKRSEHWHDPSHGTAKAHGFDGPIRTQSGDYGFPLREPVREAFQSVGFAYNPDMNSGDPNGISPLVVNWHDLKRQHASACYSLEKVQIICESIVSKVRIDDNGKAVGVQLEGDREVHANKEVIICCGGIRTPQLLLLSGIGPKDQLEKNNIPMRVDLPDVGKNYMDHYAVTMFWKLKNPENGLAFGAPAFNKPSYANSLPMDWFITGNAPDHELEKAARIDGTSPPTGPRSDYELTPMYLTNGAVPAPWLPMDGTHISCGVMCLSSTSHGTITLNSTEPNSNPTIDPRALTTEHDRAVLRAGMRAVIDAMTSPALSPYLESEEVPPPGQKSLSRASTNEELDERIRALAFPWFHAAGTAAMGKVVDGECKVKGVEALRVVDASIIPVTVTGHLQAPVYGLAERAVGMIVEAA